MATASLVAHARYVLPRFAVDGAPGAIAPHGRGHIHDSFVAEVATSAGPRRYLLQRFNDGVFADPEAVTANIATVAAHVRRKKAARGDTDDGRSVLTLVPTRDGEWLERDEEGRPWRAFEFIEGAVARERAERPEDARVAARGFAAFLRDLADAPPLAETLPHFHDTPRRLAALHSALHADHRRRAATARDAIRAVEERAALAAALTGLASRGGLPQRAVHNDTKIDNLLLDAASGRELCVIDLDTVMPGLALYDFGDLVRSLAAATPEDEPDPAKVSARPEIVVAAAQGWIEGMGPGLLSAERERLVLAARVLAFELAVRFLTDYLLGDVYFKTRRPGQNLDRCRAQLALERSLAEQEEALVRRIADLAPTALSGSGT
jgi:hypothetical protein